MKSIEEMRKAFAGKKTTTISKDFQLADDNAFFQWGKMPIGSEVAIRILWDTDNNPNGFFVTELSHKIRSDGENDFEFNKPCLRTFGEKRSDCPLCKHADSFYAKDDKVSGGELYARSAMIFRAVIQESDIVTEKGVSIVGQTYVFKASKQVAGAIESGLAQLVTPDLPCGTEPGSLDFILKKTQQGDYANYTTSRFARKSSPCNHDGKFNFNLTKAILGEKPDLAAMQQMVDADKLARG